MESRMNQSFYGLQMIAEPGGMVEHFRMVSATAAPIRQLLTARLKTDLGYYALLSYRETFRVERYSKGELAASADVRPFIEVKIPGKLIASFTEDGTPVIRSAEGIPMTDEEVSDLLFDYRAYAEADETLFMGDWEQALGDLDGEPLLEGQEVEIGGVSLIEGRIYEWESGQEYTLEEFMEIAAAE